MFVVAQALLDGFTQAEAQKGALNNRTKSKRATAKEKSGSDRSIRGEKDTIPVWISKGYKTDQEVVGWDLGIGN